MGSHGDETLLSLQLVLKWDKNRIGMRCDMELGHGWFGNEATYCINGTGKVLTFVTAEAAFSTVLLKIPVSSTSCLGMWRVGGGLSHTQFSSSIREEQCTTEFPLNNLGKMRMSNMSTVLSNHNCFCYKLTALFDSEWGGRLVYC